MYKVIKKHFKSQKIYGDIIDLFHEVTYQTELGQLMDLLTAPEDSVDLSKFNIKKYSSFKFHSFIFKHHFFIIDDNTPNNIYHFIYKLFLDMPTL